MNDMNKSNLEYVEYDFSKGYPSGSDSYYECQKCFDILYSGTIENIGCKCDNIFIDVSSARFCIEDDTKIKLMKKIIS
jgi:hypothetical protein